MKLLSRSSLVATVAAAGLLASTVPASACMFSKSSASAGGTSFDGPAGLLDKAPDSKTLGIALGSFGIVASLLTGGMVFYRKRRLARLAEQAAAVETEFNLSETVVDETAVPATTEAEADQALVLTR
jgi:Na+/glutamate symporter